MVIRILSLGFLFGVVALAACSDDENSAGSSGTTGSTAFRQCIARTESNKCTDAELEPFKACSQNACDPSYQACYGAGYKTGNFSGACATYISCTNKCECGDIVCYAGCTQDQACSDCITANNFGSCNSSCSLPACAVAGTTDGG